MKTSAVAILMATAATLLVAAAVADGMDVDVIRLPSEGRDDGQLGQAVAVEATTTPWKCCDVSVCTKSDPPSCLCLDKVERCDGACARCVEASESDPSRRVCDDRYHGDPGPRCTAAKDGGDDEEGAPAADAGEQRRKKDEEDAAAGKDRGGGGDEEPRPWPCCNNTLCTKSFPPTCSCLDVVKVCSGACQHCEPSGVDPLRHVCNDQYHGDPGPTCAKDDDHHHDDDDDVPSGASRSLAAPAPLLLAFVALLFIQSR
ncbi:unnamed protein product [Alopecurus aequalis]